MSEEVGSGGDKFVGVASDVADLLIELRGVEGTGADAGTIASTIQVISCKHAPKSEVVCAAGTDTK
jgi:hypothetical protein